MFNFSSVGYNKCIEISHLDAEQKARKSLDNALSGHNLVHAIEVVLPNITHIPESFDTILSNNEYEYYIARDIPLWLLVDLEFIGAFVKQGEFFGLSHGTRIDVDDCVAVYPSGLLILSLTKDTYEQLGIQGKQCRLLKSQHRKFVIDINLTDDKSFCPGKRGYARINQTFLDRNDLKFDLLCRWDPHDADISSRSICNYLASRGCQIEICTLQQDTKCLYSVPMPLISWNKWQNDADTSVPLVQFVDWLGNMTCHIDLSSDVDDYISSYTCPEPNEIMGQVAHKKWSGFLTSNTVQKVFENISSLIKLSDRHPWASLVVHGFDDAPLIENQKIKHSGFSTENRDHMFCVVLFPDSGYWLHQSEPIRTFY